MKRKAKTLQRRLRAMVLVLLLGVSLCLSMTTPASAKIYIATRDQGFIEWVGRDPEEVYNQPKPRDLAEANCYTSGSIGSAESTGIMGGVWEEGDIADPIQQTVTYQEGIKNVTEAVTDDVKWVLKDGVLTLSGTGPTAMGLNRLFEGNEYIETVVIEEGITDMPGLCYFQNIPNLKTIIFMDAGTNYNQVAYNCPNLKTIIVGTNLKNSIFIGGVTMDFDKTIMLSKNVASYSTSEYAQGITVRDDCNVYTHKTTSGVFITNGVISDTSGANAVNAKAFFKNNTVVPYGQILAKAQAALADVPVSVLAKLPAELFAEVKEPVQPAEPVAPEETDPETVTGTEDFTNSESHLRTSHSENNYVDISVSGNTLTVSGRLVANGLTKIKVSCGSSKTVNVSSGELFTAGLSLTHSGKKAVNVYTYQGSSAGKGLTCNRIYIEKTSGGYRVMPSLVQENNTAFEASYIDPSSTLTGDIPASVAAKSNEIVGSETDDYAKVFLLHKWVAENIYYDYDALYGRSERITDSAGVLEVSRSVCEGYSRLLKDLILAQGIPAMYCLNDSTDGSYATNTCCGEAHAHVEAYVNGRWITMDPAWDSNNEYRGGSYTAQAPNGYYYFDISSEAFALDHKITARGNKYYVTDESGFGIRPSDGTLVAYEGKGGDIVLPGNITSIQAWAFQDCTGITSVVIPAGVTSIGYEAFKGCTNLKSVTIPDRVTTIGDGAFSGCTSLKSANIPASVTAIGDSLFNGCKSLESIVLPRNTTSIGDWAFYGCASLKSVTIPDSVTSIGLVAFSGCTGLKSVTIPGNVRMDTMTQSIFYGCTGLQHVTISDGVTYIPACTFENCKSLTDVTIPASVTAIGIDAFLGCKQLTAVYGVAGSYAEDWAEQNGLTFVDGEKPEDEEDEALEGLTVSDWAQESVLAAMEAGIVPDTLPANYTRAINRANFCALAVSLYETMTGSEITGRSEFTDTSDVNVQKMACLGVVNGYGGGVFGPDHTITREQAAAILSRLAEAMGVELTGTGTPFADTAGSWALESIAKVYGAGIMQGYSGATFGGKNSYTIQQSVVTMLRLMSCMGE